MSSISPGPTHPPANVTAFNTSSTSILITWSEVPQEHQHYAILGYHVIYYRDNDSQINNITILSNASLAFEAKDLRKYTKYFIQVTAYNIYGAGNASKLLEVFTNEDGMLARYILHLFTLR